MEFLKPFFINLSFFITLTFIGMLLHKYVFYQAAQKFHKVLVIGLAIGSGWLSMYFGLRINPDVIFDLRFVPLIICTLWMRSPISVAVIGVGIGLLRYSFGINPASTAGFINLSILGFVAMFLNYWVMRSERSFLVKSLCVAAVINFVNVINIGVFGVLQFKYYITEIAPITLPISMVLSLFFNFCLRDLQLQQLRMRQLEAANHQLQVQANILSKTKQELEDKAGKLAKLSQYKSEFLANMSHELRTPLNSIVILSQLLKENQEDEMAEEEKKFAAIIQTSAEDLSHMINEMLDLSKLETGEMEITVGAVNLTELPGVLTQKFAFVAEQKGIDFQIHKAGNVPDLIYSDPLRLQQILNNLLVNAFKFTDYGSVSLYFEAANQLDLPADKQRMQGREWLKISVQDTGIGIPQDKHELIFEAFQQADGRSSRKYGGIGVGLAISRDLAHLLGGFLLLESREGHGSTFTLYIPNLESAATSLAQ